MHYNTRAVHFNTRAQPSGGAKGGGNPAFLHKLQCVLQKVQSVLQKVQCRLQKVQSDGSAARRVVRASAVVSAVVGRRVALLVGLLGGGQFVEDFQLAIGELRGIEGDGLGFA